MSFNPSNKYPLSIENLGFNDDFLHFTVINNTDGTCNIYLNDKLIKSTNDAETEIVEDVSDVYVSRFNVKVENGDNFILKSIGRDLSSYFNNLNKTIRGKDDYFFLVNDRNSEIRLHYDNSYEHNLDIDRFRESTISKQSFLEKKGINYALFVVPDKSITLQDKLPFITGSPFRYTDSLDDILYDLNPIITGEDRLKTDTHISYLSSLKVVPYIASILSEEDYQEIKDRLIAQTHLEDTVLYGDLFNNQNWSYDRDELFHENRECIVKKVVPNHPYEKVELNEIPEEFRHISRRDAIYYKNENSISDKRAVILHDSTTLMLIESFIAYYSEVFFYWDHWFFNNELIEWFNPDDVVEIRTERFVDDPQYPLVNDNYFTNFPISAELKEFSINKSELNAKILIKDYRQLAINTNIKAFLNDVLISEEDSNALYYTFNYPLTDYENGEYTLRFEIKSRYKFREIIKDFILEDSLESQFEGLKLTFKGIGDTFFMVNDNANELRQHYDKMYVTNFDRKRFIVSINSKIRYLEKMDINYMTFIIPDKSVVLSDYIPFNDGEIYRNADSLNDYLVDLKNIIVQEDYLLNDTNVSMCAGLKIVSYILSVMDNVKTAEEYKRDIADNVTLRESKHRGNLFTNRSWSYTDDMELHDKYYEVDTIDVCLNDDVIEVDENEIPEDFRIFSTIKSQYFKNSYSLSDKKALVLCDDSIKPLIPPLLAFYKEVFFYQDLWYFNKKLVDWFKPDDLLEIRSERTLENTQYQLVSIEDNFVIPILRNVEEFKVADNKLKIKIIYKDLRQKNVKSVCDIFIDKKLIGEINIDGVLDVCYNIDKGKHLVEVVLNASDTTKRNVYKQKLDVDK